MSDGDAGEIQRRLAEAMKPENAADGRFTDTRFLRTEDVVRDVKSMIGQVMEQAWEDGLLGRRVTADLADDGRMEVTVEKPSKVLTVCLQEDSEPDDGE